jgi:predicted ester cyclase
MAIESNMEAARQVIEEAFNKGNYAVLQTNFRPTFIEHQFGMHATVEGLQGDIEFLRRAFPDIHLTLEAITADGDKVWMCSTARGTNLGGFMGPPNGKSFEISVFDLARFQDGRIVEHWGSPDRFALLAQLGILPQNKQEALKENQE